MHGAISTEQAREIFALRLRHPGAELIVHRQAWGLIVEVRRGRRTVALAGHRWQPAEAPPVALPEPQYVAPLDLAA